MKIMFEYIKEKYNLPFLKRGLKVLFQEKEAKITGVISSYLVIKIGKIKKIVHPLDLVYFENFNKK